MVWLALALYYMAGCFVCGVLLTSHGLPSKDSWILNIATVGMVIAFWPFILVLYFVVENQK